MKSQRNSAFFLLLLAFLLSNCGSRSRPPASGGNEPTAEEPTAPAGEFEKAFLTEVNALRQNGCTCGDGRRMPPVPPLHWNDKLESAARRHVRDLARHDHFSHTGTDGSTMAGRVEDAGYPWAAVAENIAVGTNTPQEGVEQWRKSKQGHCQTMMSDKYRETGAAYEDGAEGRYWVMVVASR